MRRIKNTIFIILFFVAILYTTYQGQMTLVKYPQMYGEQY
jgi:hypothetical protein